MWNFHSKRKEQKKIFFLIFIIFFKKNCYFELKFNVEMKVVERRCINQMFELIFCIIIWPFGPYV